MWLGGGREGGVNLDWKDYKSESRGRVEGMEVKGKNNNHNGGGQGEIGEQMNWTMSLRARAEGQVLCEAKKNGWRERDGGGGWRISERLEGKWLFNPSFLHL